MIISLQDNQDFYACHVVVDGATGVPIDPQPFYADDEAGVYRSFSRDAQGKVYILPKANELAWEEVTGVNIRIVPKSPTAVADRIQALRARAPQVTNEDIELIRAPLRAPTDRGRKKP